MGTDFKWGELIVRCVRQLRDAGEGAPFVDVEVIPPFDGRPDGIFVWFICETVTLKERFRSESLHDASLQLRALAAEAGFPLEAAVTLRTDVTSTEEIEAGGGRFYFFR
jgi:hypothetical protein